MPDLPHGTDPETVARDGAPIVLLRAALRVALPLALVLVVGSFVMRGTAGGVTAAVSAAAMLLIHWGTAKAATIAGRVSPQVLQAVTMFGFLGRLVLYGALAFVFNGVAGIDAPVLAIVVVALTIAILVAESRVALRYSKLWWQPTEDRPADPHSTQTAAAVTGKDRA